MLKIPNLVKFDLYQILLISFTGIETFHYATTWLNGWLVIAIMVSRASVVLMTGSGCQLAHWGNMVEILQTKISHVLCWQCYQILIQIFLKFITNEMMQELQKRCIIVFRSHLSSFKVTRVKQLTIWLRFERLPFLFDFTDGYEMKDSILEHGTGFLLFFKIIGQISRSHGLKIWWNGSDCCDITQICPFLT